MKNIENNSKLKDINNDNISILLEYEKPHDQIPQIRTTESVLSRSFPECFSILKNERKKEKNINHIKLECNHFCVHISKDSDMSVIKFKNGALSSDELAALLYDLHRSFELLLK